MTTLLYSLYNFFTEFGRIRYKIWSGILWWEYLRILPQYSFIWEASGIFNICTASNSEIRVFFPSIYSSEGSDTKKSTFTAFAFSSRKSRREGDEVHGAFAQCWDPKHWGCLHGQHTCTAAGPAPGHGMAHPTKMGNIATEERRTAGEWSPAVVLAILLLPRFGHIIKKYPCDEQRCPTTNDDH